MSLPSTTLRPLGIPLLAALVAVLGLGLGRPAAPTAPADVPESVAQDPLGAARAFSEAVQSLCAQVGPAIVAVEVLEPSNWSRRGKRVARRASGVIVSGDGWIVTNYHVVKEAKELRIALGDGRELPAEVRGLDPDTDLAVLRVAAEDLPFAELSERARPQVGEWVLAMGNPRGLDLTVTQGIVSGNGRSDLGLARYEDFVQTDAAINPGNSGGALVDLDGRVIGISTAMGIESEGSVGIGFAIPAAFVQPVLEGIVEDGRVRRGFLGVSFGYLSREAAKRSDYDGTSTVYLRSVSSGSPAASAGLLIGDVIEGFDSRPVRDAQDLSNAIGMSRPGLARTIDVWRDSERIQLEVVLAERGR
jgi:S1-C subfamily serine protease